MTIELKIKSKHLALEPAIIREEENRLKERIKFLRSKNEDTASLQSKRESLHLHRKFNVRNEARATLLARTFLDGKPYSFCEKKRKADREDNFQRNIIPRIGAMIRKYGNDSQRLTEDKAIWEWSKITNPVAK